MERVRLIASSRRAGAVARTALLAAVCAVASGCPEGGNRFVSASGSQAEPVFDFYETGHVDSATYLGRLFVTTCDTAGGTVTTGATKWHIRYLGGGPGAVRRVRYGHPQTRTHNFEFWRMARSLM